MGKLVSLVISAHRRALISLAVNLLLFLALTTAIAVTAVGQTYQYMQREAVDRLQPFADVDAKLRTAFAALRDQVTAEPCSTLFNRQLRRIAYLPDGFNEFLYAPGGVVQCSIHVLNFTPTIDLGPLDWENGGGPRGIWFNRDLSFLGLKGFRGAIAFDAPFAVVFPQPPVQAVSAGWMAAETVAIDDDGRGWHRGGVPDVYKRYQESIQSGFSLVDPVLSHFQCTAGGPVCVAVQVSLWSLLWSFKVYVFGLLLISLVSAGWLSRRVSNLVERWWSFESRFCRNLRRDTVICAYQPILNLVTGEIAGCEVLARWRDVDDATVYPDRFIPIIEKHGLTRPFTQMVAERAFAELRGALPSERRLNVTFNIFPCDLDCTTLSQIFQQFQAAPDRFKLIVELVESGAIVVPDAQRQIEALRAVGIQTYIDDFGTGYSNIHNLAALSVDGVKLDRSFAMAPDGSLMDQMLGHAIGMVRSSGRVMVIEGIETAGRLQQLRAMTPPIDFVQGYFISRPLDIVAFAAFIEAHRCGFLPRDLAA